MARHISTFPEVPDTAGSRGTRSTEHGRYAGRWNGATCVSA